MTEFCITCKFVREHTELQQLVEGGRSVRTVTSHLLCQFAAPLPQFFGNAEALWPEVKADDWCGSYKHDPTAYDGSIRFFGNASLQADTRSNQQISITFAGSGGLAAAGGVP